MTYDAAIVGAVAALDHAWNSSLLENRERLWATVSPALKRRLSGAPMYRFGFTRWRFGAEDNNLYAQLLAAVWPRTADSNGYARKGKRSQETANSELHTLQFFYLVVGRWDTELALTPNALIQEVPRLSRQQIDEWVARYWCKLRDMCQEYVERTELTPDPERVLLLGTVEEGNVK